MNAGTPLRIMTEQEFKKRQAALLDGYINCKKLEREHRSSMSFLSKRHVKGASMAVGQLLKESRVISQVGIERVFKNFK